MSPPPTDHTTNSAFYDRISKAYDLIADCKPINVTRFVQDSGMKIISDEREGMWGMDVAITVAAKPT